MVPPGSSPTPLLDALLLAEGYLTPWHAELCQVLQKHDYAHLTLTEIALRCGYLSTVDLERAQQQLQETRAALARAVEIHAPVPADLNALIIADRPIAALTIALTRLGVAVCYATHLPDHPALQAPDLILIDPSRLPACSTMPYTNIAALLDPSGLPACSTMPYTSMIALLPPDLVRWPNRGTAPLGTHNLLESYVRQAREYRSVKMRAPELATTSRIVGEAYRAARY